jgi:DNA modification methylase
MPLLGFENIYLERLIAGKLGKHPETTPLVPPNPCVLPGDLWLLGKHRLLCGSATVAEDVKRVLDGEKPALMVTDPPYGVNYDPEWRNRSGLNAWAALVQVGTVDADHRNDWTEAWKLFPGDVAYVWHAGKFAGEVQASLAAADLLPRSQIIWRKPHFAIGRGDYHWRHEPCWYCVRKGKKSNWRGGRKQTTVWDILGFQVAGGHRDEAKTGHGTQKPLDCMGIPIANNSAPGELIYDPFVGSGTTIMAADTQARRCAAIDINPGYVEVCIQRWQDFTGKSATLDGRTFDVVRKERLQSAHQKSNRRKPVPGRQRGPAASKRGLPQRSDA